MTRTVLITGASNGIGRAIAARFAAGGDTVVITGRHAGRLRQAAAELGVRGIVCDATDTGQVAALTGQLGPALDVLINNAGGNTDFDEATAARQAVVPEPPPADQQYIATQQAATSAQAAISPQAATSSQAATSDQAATSSQAATSPQEAAPGPSGTAGERDKMDELLGCWRANLEANLLSAVLTTHALAGRLVPGGSVISIGSIGAERGAGSYGAAKAALSAWSTGVSADLGPRGITANVISAGLIADTNFFRGRLSSERYDRLVSATHDKRAGQPADIAETAYFLASSGARHITGQTIHVNGGAFTTR